jgi:hypothetical protein
VDRGWAQATDTVLGRAEHKEALWHDTVDEKKRPAHPKTIGGRFRDAAML